MTGAENVDLDVPENPDFGDYSTNIAMKLAGVNRAGKKNPIQLAEDLISRLNKDSRIKKNVEKINLAGPGFINFYLNKEVLVDTLVSICSQKFVDRYSQLLKRKKIVVEYTDPNPFKEFHVGHLYSNTVGESIARLLEALGANVWRADYFGDVGMHVAKAIWGILAKFSEDGLTMQDLASKDLKSRIEYFGSGYSKGATAYEEEEVSKEDMKSLNFLIFRAAQDSVLPEFSETPQVDYGQYIKPGKYDYQEIKNIYSLGRKWSLEYFETIYKRVGTKFKGYYPESRTGEFGYGMVLDGLKKGIFEKGEGGAIIFPGEKYGLHNRVFINQLNLPTYETKDFGNAVAKYKDFAYDKSVIVTGNEINDYFHVVLKALSLYRPELAESTKHIGHGMVRLPEGKMSSRTGKIVRGEWVLDESKKKVLEIISKGDNPNKLSDTDKDKIAEEVAVGAVKYAFLKQGIGNNLSFDFDSSLALEGNSGPYLQYTYARTQSVLAKATVTKPQITEEIDINKDEEMLLRTFVHYPDVVIDSAEKYSPSILCTYLYVLAQKYNAYYASKKIIGGDNEKLGLTITYAVGVLLKEGLKLLGIEAPEKM